MRNFALILLFIASPAFAQDSQLVGSWKLVSYQLILDSDPPKDQLGKEPKGELILTNDGRVITILASDTRAPAKTDQERSELFKSMIAYAGKYRIEGKEIITTVEVSWNEAWNGTDQRRLWRIEDGKLFIESVPQPSTLFPGKTAVGRSVWERRK
ncbi:MAG TPA: lipocalin-like domain-containing protein [Hyphomicrobiaceae bacterium]|jgi:hypothetical protein|nr:lipocalin-like domain-containing protein [Hyphomicrobiaceae bacterium]